MHHKPELFLRQGSINVPHIAKYPYEQVIILVTRKSFSVPSAQYFATHQQKVNTWLYIIAHRLPL